MATKGFEKAWKLVFGAQTAKQVAKHLVRIRFHAPEAYVDGYVKDRIDDLDKMGDLLDAQYVHQFYDDMCLAVAKALELLPSRFEIAIQHDAHGRECVREYQGTELGAKRAAAKLARQGGRGWTPVVISL